MKEDTKECILWKLDNGRKAYFRGGSTMKNILTNTTGTISGEDALALHNTYGIRVDQLKIFLFSLGLDMDDDKFAELLLEQIEKSKNTRAYAQSDREF